MFKSPFSFNGRIKRTEFGISFIIYIVIYLVILALISNGGVNGIFGLIIIPAIWFLWAQGAKRCHDLNKSGIWQIIPFYVFWLLFAKGDPMGNQYDIYPSGQALYGADDYEKPFVIDADEARPETPISSGIE